VAGREVVVEVLAARAVQARVVLPVVLLLVVLGMLFPSRSSSCLEIGWLMVVHGVAVGGENPHNLPTP